MEQDVAVVSKLLANKPSPTYVGDGSNRRGAVHHHDAANLFRLALEKGVAGHKYHGAAEENSLKLGAQYRRLRTRLGAPKAITAMACKLACLYYRFIKHGQQHVVQGAEHYEARCREQPIRTLAKKAAKLGVQVVVPPAA